ncbi:hypothetical protein [Glaciimonas sp. PAMC28666]|uniref:hypothetical protein n=1 Tax=Glaciimonas sp. PAMC28666 TaxID=2807626 RepID=UPI0019649EA7|nr:hypothetical protein [Glaciimonas sp. PAMC28666]QRX82225.1 hypothetical protein JQN73_19365 [Glaciimonas sp. PAMC28666]
MKFYLSFYPMTDRKELNGMPDKYPELASRIQAAMKDNAITVTDIRIYLSISYEMARRYTLGQAMPRQDKILMLAELLKLSPAYLQFGSEGRVGKKSRPASELDHLQIDQKNDDPMMIDADDLTKLIDLFAQSTDKGRSFILKSAVAAEKVVVNRGQRSTLD